MSSKALGKCFKCKDGHLTVFEDGDGFYINCDDCDNFSDVNVQSVGGCLRLVRKR